MLKLIEFYNFIHQFKEAVTLFFGRLFDRVYIRFYLGGLLFLNALIWIFARYIDSKIDEKMIALHYSVDFGIDYYGSTYKIYVIPFLGLFIIIINTLVFNSVGSSKDRRFLSHLLLLSAIVVNIVLLASTTTIYLINF